MACKWRENYDVIWEEHAEIGILPLHCVKQKSVPVLSNFQLVSDTIK